MLNKETTEEDINIYDPASVDWASFSFPNGYYEHTISKTEIVKPYLISQAYYGTIIYEDILFLINKVDDPFCLRVGAELLIPKLEDLENFILEQKKLVTVQ